MIGKKLTCEGGRPRRRFNFRWFLTYPVSDRPTMMEAGLGLRVPTPIAKAPRRMVVVLADDVPLAAPAYSRNRPETQRTRDISRVNEARAHELAAAGASDIQRSRIHAGLQRVSKMTELGASDRTLTKDDLAWISWADFSEVYGW